MEYFYYRIGYETDEESEFHTLMTEDCEYTQEEFSELVSNLYVQVYRDAHEYEINPENFKDFLSKDFQYQRIKDNPQFINMLQLVIEKLINDCGFQPINYSVSFVNQGWNVVDPDRKAFDYGVKRKEDELVQHKIKKYKEKNEK